MPLKLTITGKVHDVGYRPFLLGLAEALEIERFFADNVTVDGIQAVEVLVDDSDDKINAFVELVNKKKPENAEVESVRVEHYDGIVMKIESYYRYLTAMQLAKIATYGGRMLEKQDKMLEKQDLMLEKLDTVSDKIDKVSDKLDVVSDKLDVVSEKIDKVSDKLDVVSNKIDKVSDNILDLRTDLKQHLDERLKRLEEDVREIKMKIGMA